MTGRQLDIHVPRECVRGLGQQGVGLRRVSCSPQDVDLGQDAGAGVAPGVEAGVHGRQPQADVAPEHPDIICVLGGEARIPERTFSGLDIGRLGGGVVAAGHQHPGADGPGLRPVQSQGHAPVDGLAGVVMPAHVVEGGREVMPGYGAVGVELHGPPVERQRLLRAMEKLEGLGARGQGQVVRKGVADKGIGEADGSGGITGLQEGHRLLQCRGGHVRVPPGRLRRRRSHSGR